MRSLSVNTYYQLSWITFLPCSLLLASSSKIIPLWMALVALALAGACLTAKDFGGAWSTRYRTLIVIGFAIICWVHGTILYIRTHDIFLIIGEVLAGLIPLLVSRKQKTFGYWMGLLTSCLLAMVGVIGGSGLLEYVLLLVLLLALVFNLNAANLLSLAGPTGSLQQVLPEKYFRQLLPSLTIGLAVGVLIFFAFPRAPRFWNPFKLRQRGGAVSGYTGSVSLMSVGTITESSQLAMMVESENTDWLMKDGPTLYFRGNTLDYFDGQDWFTPNHPSWTYQPAVDLRYTLSSKLPARKLKIFREPHTTQAVVYPQVLLGINAPVALFGELHYDSNANLFRTHVDELRYSYEVLVSEPSIPRQMGIVTLAELRQAIERHMNARPFVAGILQGNLPVLLQIPPNVKDQPWFKDWVSEIGVDRDKATLIEVYAELSRHFQSRFRATLSRPPRPSADSFRSFLADDRSGHCEFFATATVLYLRSLGVPARLILGYRGGTFNDVSRVLEVREMNAHAWVEAYFPLTGWVAFDPTPLAPSSPLTGFGVYASLYANAAKYWFNRYVVNYNTQAQRDLLKSMANAHKGSAPVSVIIPWNLKTLECVLVFIVLVLYVTWIQRRQRMRERAGYKCPDYYRSFVKRIADLGWERHKGETYRRFHDRLVAGGVTPDLVRELDGALERDLYSNRNISDTLAKSLKRKIRQATRLLLVAKRGS